MIHGKRMIFMVLPLLFVPLVYGISSTPDACALPPDPKRQTSTDCRDVIGGTLRGGECCWTGDDGEKYCQTCWVTKTNVDGDPLEMDCDAVELQFGPPPGENLPQLEQVPPTPPPMFGLGQNLPQDLPTLQETPPRFGLNPPQDLPTLEQAPPTPLTPLPPTPPPRFGLNPPQDLPTLEEVPVTPLPTGPLEVLEPPDVEEQDGEEEPEQPSADEGSEGNN
jgi:hypothetical protein